MLLSVADPVLDWNSQRLLLQREVIQVGSGSVFVCVCVLQIKMVVSSEFVLLLKLNIYIYLENKDKISWGRYFFSL